MESAVTRFMRASKKNTRWNVLFVEPVPSIFEVLKQNYGEESRFIFENAGINANGTNQLFYTVNEAAFSEIPNLSEKYRQIGSFDKNHIPKLSKGKLNDYVTGIEVNCMTLEQLFQKNKIDGLDLFIIDAEGYDWKILSQLNLSKYQPAIINFEFCNLSDSEKQDSIDFLKEIYHVFEFRINFLCIKKDIIRPKDLNILKTRLVK